MEAFMDRFHPQWLHAHDLIRTGAIGDVRTVQSAYFYDFGDTHATLTAGTLTPLSDALANQRVLDAPFASEVSGNREPI
ncbi:MAG: hypothetical protein ACLFPV_12660 [Spirochaetaceae bacterium]